jgi:GGDEF domain-containing protein
MDRIAAGFWGAFFCTASLMLLMSLAAFAQSHKRVALMAALTSLVSAGFVVAYLGLLPIEGEVEARVLGHVAVLAAISLALMLMLMLGMLRRNAVDLRTLAPVLATGALAIAVGWLLEPPQQLALGSLYANTLAAAMVVVAVRGALRGDRAGWAASAVLVLAMVSVAGLTWIALKRPPDWPVHALSATAGIAYLCLIARMLWARYSYLLELAEVMRHGPSYDPVTRMRSHSETGQLVGDVFFRHDSGSKPVAVIAICIANLYALENLHGRAAFNHALFVCAGRLRRCVPQYVEMGRLGEDGFLLLVRNADDMNKVEQLARTVRERLVRPVALSTSRDAAVLDAAGTTWAAEVGIGVLGTTTEVRPSQAVNTARAMARTAWSYGSRLARYDTAAGQIAELPKEDPESLRQAA